VTNEDLNIFRVIADAWKLAGIADQKNLPGLGMSQLLELADDNNRKGMPTTVNNWMMIFDECGAWFGNLATLLMFSLRTDPSRDIRLRRVLTCVIGAISAQIIAIRRLVLSGLDVQAKQLLRVLIENLDVALLIPTDENALRDFELTVDGSSSNEFWHRYISKGKIRSKVHSRMRHDIGDGPYKEFLEYLKQEEQILGMAVHPSLGASQMACLPRIAEANTERPFTLGFVGDASVFSERTLSYAVFYMIFYILDGYVPVGIQHKELNDDAGKILKQLQDRISLGRIALGHIVTYAIENNHSTEFSSRVSSELLTS
jgi:hypothetical protein